MKFGIDIGHNDPPDTGSPGIPGTGKTEDVLTMAVGKLVMRKLVLAGHEVISLLPSKAGTVRDSLRQRVEKANEQNVDVVVSIHFNDSDDDTANGTEVYAMSEGGKRYALAVLLEICKLGFFNRGVKEGRKFYMIRRPKAKSILIEACFCDNTRDMKLFDAETMAGSIVRGLLAAATKE
jgi:N-acetylmuramoyl-L-alanine amidase